MKRMSLKALRRENNLFKAGRSISTTPAGNALFPQRRPTDIESAMKATPRNWAYNNSIFQHKATQNDSQMNWGSILSKSKSLGGACEAEPSEIARSVRNHHQRFKQLDDSASYSASSLGDSIQINLNTQPWKDHKSFSSAVSHEKVQRSISLIRNGRKMIAQEGNNDQQF